MVFCVILLFSRVGVLFLRLFFCSFHGFPPHPLTPPPPPLTFCVGFTRVLLMHMHVDFLTHHTSLASIRIITPLRRINNVAWGTRTYIPLACM